MAKAITVSDHEPAVEWANKLAREAGEGRIYPEEYEFDDVGHLAQLIRGDTNQRANDLYKETVLSFREAEAIAMKEAGLTHRGIALVMSMYSSDTEVGVRPSTVDEFVRRARTKYQQAQTTRDLLDEQVLGIAE